MLPKMAFTGFASRYREPTLDEGFDDITKVNFKVRPFFLLACVGVGSISLNLAPPTCSSKYGATSTDILLIVRWDRSAEDPMAQVLGILSNCSTCGRKEGKGSCLRMHVVVSACKTQDAGSLTCPQHQQTTAR
jgi:hypothetical protein